MQLKYSISAFLVCAALLLSIHGSLAASNDWVVTIKTSTMEKCLDYPDSNLKPVVRASVYFEQGLGELSEEEKEIQNVGHLLMKKSRLPNTRTSSTVTFIH